MGWGGAGMPGAVGVPLRGWGFTHLAGGDLYKSLPTQRL